MKLNDKTYDFLKELSLTYLPLLGAMLLAFTNIWGWNIPADKIVASFSEVEAFLCGILKISTIAYQKEQAEDKPVDDGNYRDEIVGEG